MFEKVKEFLKTEKIVRFDPQKDWKYSDNNISANCKLAIESKGKIYSNTYLEIDCYTQSYKSRTEFALIFENYCITRLKINPNKPHSNSNHKLIDKEFRGKSYPATKSLIYSWNINEKLLLKTHFPRGVRVAKEIEEKLNFESFNEVRDYFFNLCYIEGNVSEPNLNPQLPL